MIGLLVENKLETLTNLSMGTMLLKTLRRGLFIFMLLMILPHTVKSQCGDIDTSATNYNQLLDYQS